MDVIRLIEVGEKLSYNGESRRQFVENETKKAAEKERQQIEREDRARERQERAKVEEHKRELEKKEIERQQAPLIYVNVLVRLTLLCSIVLM